MNTTYTPKTRLIPFWEAIRDLADEPDMQANLLEGRAELLMCGDTKRGIAIHDPEQAFGQLGRDCTDPDGNRPVPISAIRRAIAAALAKMRSGIGHKADDSVYLYDSQTGTTQIQTGIVHHGRELFAEIAGWDENAALGFGIPELDRACGGFYPGEVMGLVGAPGSMKTSLALNMCEQALKNADGRVLFFSLDMSTRQVSMRLLQRELDCFKADVIEMGRRKAPELTEAHRRLQQAFAGRLFLVGQRKDGVDLTWENMKEIAIQTAPDLVIVDYVQLIGGYRSDMELLHDVLPKIISAAGDSGQRFLLLSQMGRTGRADQKNKLGDHAAGGYYFQARLDIEIELFSEKDSYGNGHIIAGVGKTRNGAAGRCFDIEYSPRTLAFTGRSKEVKRTGKNSKIFEL